MDLILRDGYIYLVKNEVPANNRIEGRVITKYLKDPANTKLYFSLNDEPFKPLPSSILIIEKEDLKKPFLDLKIKAQTKEGTEVFHSDRLPITYTLVIGERLEDTYTRTITAILKRLDRMDKKVREAEEKLQNLEEVGELI